MKTGLALLSLAMACCFFAACKGRSSAPDPKRPGSLRPVDREFLAACGRGDLAAVKRCLLRGADIRVRSNYRSGFFPAMDSGSLELMGFLLEKEKKLAVLPDAYGVRPLGYLVRGYGSFAPGSEEAGRLALLDLLLSAGADMEATDDYGYGLTPIFFASGRFAPFLVEALIARGARVNRPTLTDYDDSFCDVDFTLPAGSTPLDKYQALLEVVPADEDFAVFRTNLQAIIQVLKKHGARNGAWAARRKPGAIT
jgi:hypothetical protein